jgi:hypothetical protein
MDAILSAATGTGRQRTKQRHLRRRIAGRVTIRTCHPVLQPKSRNAVGNANKLHKRRI